MTQMTATTFVDKAEAFLRAHAELEQELETKLRPIQDDFAAKELKLKEEFVGPGIRPEAALLLAHGAVDNEWYLLRPARKD